MIGSNYSDPLVPAPKHSLVDYDTWVTLKPQVYIFLLPRNVANSDFRLFAAQSHQDSLDTIRNRDEARAETLIVEHLQSAYQRIQQAYPCVKAASLTQKHYRLTSMHTQEKQR